MPRWLPHYPGNMSAWRAVAWLGFCLFVAVSWAALGLYAFVAGQGPCEESGTCLVDEVVGVFGLLLLPLQVLAFVWMRQRWDDNEG